MAVIDKPVENMNRIEFGNGQIATLIDVNVLPSEDVVEFKFIPNKMMSYAEKIPDEDRDKRDWSITRRYKREYCYQANSTPGNICWKLFCDYHERPTYEFEFINAKILSERDAYKNQLKAMTRIASSYASELLRLGKNVDGFKNAVYKDMERMSKIVAPAVPTNVQPQVQTEGEFE